MDYQKPPTQYLDPRDYKSQQLQDFLKKISMLESSGGTDTDHETMKSGIQAGDTAIGNYGLMPNTLQELSNRYPSEITNGLSKEELGQKAQSDPGFANTMAGTMADYLKNKRCLSDEESAAAWESGQHTPVDQLDLNSPRAKRFRVLNAK